MGFKTRFAAISAGVMLATGASAASLDITNVTGIWSSTNPGAPTVSGQGTDTISWGTPFGQPDQSSYNFAGIAPPTQPNIAPNTPFTLGTFTHNNNPITGDVLATAELTVDITFDLFDDFSNPIGSQTVTSVFDFEHLESPNEADPCADGGANGVGVNVNGCADRVTATLNVPSSTSFTVNGETFFFNVTGFGDPAFDEFWTVENQSNAVDLRATWTSRVSTVPLPAAGWMLIAGLGGLAAMARRRKTS
jgi:hypothetical protein